VQDTDQSVNVLEEDPLLVRKTCLYKREGQRKALGLVLEHSDVDVWGRESFYSYQME
jgi:hypothetical protein